MLRQYPTIKQIVLITDGCSNFGGDPVQAAAEASDQGYVVSTVGIIDGGDLDNRGIDEVQQVAGRGGGVCDLVEVADLAASLQKVVRQTAQLYLERIIQMQFSTLLDAKAGEAVGFGTGDRLVAMRDRLSDEAYLQCVIGLDASRSMRDKLEGVKQGVLEFTAWLRSRRGKSEVAVVCFPSPNGELTRIMANFNDNSQALGPALARVLPGGGTPTAPAIREAVRVFRRYQARVEQVLAVEETAVVLSQYSGAGE